MIMSFDFRMLGTNGRDRNKPVRSLANTFQHPDLTKRCMTKSKLRLAWVSMTTNIYIILIFPYAGQMNHTQDNMLVAECCEGRTVHWV
jgi:hypothetical protein